MPHILNIVQRPAAGAVKGVTQTSHMRLNDLIGVTDPLATAAASANKAATSIPSMFARILFFRTAFGSITNPTVTTSVYAKFVSDCLDLLEDLFNHNTQLSLMQWNKNIQLNTLGANPVLRDALQSQMNKFLPYVSDIYLIIDNAGQVVGGTSPFTIVYTSPNWVNNRPVTMLQNRTPKFREFMYSFADAYAAGNSNLAEFVNYINNCKHFDVVYNHVNFAGLWSVGTLSTTFPILQCAGNNVIIENPPAPAQPLYLFASNPANFDSDMFLASTLQPFNRGTTPLLLVSGALPLRYYGAVLYNGWGAGFTEIWNPNNDTIPRPLPGAGALQHTFITPVDLLEDCMIKVPYEINDNSWDMAINVNGMGCMLPLKPLLFKYFSIDEVRNMLSVNIDGINQKVAVRLNVPVRDAAGNQNVISVKKEYAFNEISGFPGLTEGYTVGVAPFYSGAGKYHVVHCENSANVHSSLDLYKIGNSNPINLNPFDIKDGPIRLNLYTVNGDFDYIRVVWGNKNGILLPKLKETGNGASTYTYCVDFGTTNTHIAFTNDGRTVHSFGPDDYKWNVEYLSENGKTGDDSIKTLLARVFFPDYSQRDYDFPIRTVVSGRGNLNPNSKVLESVSIGFRYSKEYVTNEIYNTELKWKFDKDPTDNNVQVRVRCFCEEIMMMIRNHWMQQSNADRAGYPKIAITYPAAMINPQALTTIWDSAYTNVFNVNAANLVTITESLAPCRTAIAGGIGLANGMLNIDIGGGSTDFQYYKRDGVAAPVSLYNSVKFAGDDLWGKCYENVGGRQLGAAVASNKFTEYAQNSLGNAQIKIGADNKNIGAININNPKEFIGVLLKDGNNNFANILKGSSNVCKQIMFLHYAAIMYYAMKWLQENGVDQLPRNITFTGLGSKYLELLFGRDVFTSYSKYMIEIFSGKPAADISISLPGNNPKNVTAEGACLYAADGEVPDCRLAYSLGCGVRDITYGNVRDLRTKVIETLDDFIDKFNQIGNCNGILLPNEVVVISKRTKEQFLSDAANSFDQMVNTVAGFAPEVQMNDAVFFWAFKDSLWKLV